MNILKFGDDTVLISSMHHQSNLQNYFNRVEEIIIQNINFINHYLTKPAKINGEEIIKSN